MRATTGPGSLDNDESSCHCVQRQMRAAEAVTPSDIRGDSCRECVFGGGWGGFVSDRESCLRSAFMMGYVGCTMRLHNRISPRLRRESRAWEGRQVVPEGGRRSIIVVVGGVSTGLARVECIMLIFSHVHQKSRGLRQMRARNADRLRQACLVETFFSPPTLHKGSPIEFIMVVSKDAGEKDCCTQRVQTGKNSTAFVGFLVTCCAHPHKHGNVPN